MKRTTIRLSWLPVPAGPIAPRRFLIASNVRPLATSLGGRTAGDLKRPASTIAVFMRAWASPEGSPLE